MKKLFFTILCTFFLFNISIAHKQHVHQRLVIEGFNLLKKWLVYTDVPIMRDKIGDYSTIGVGPWQLGYVTTGAWREDVEDVVYHYGIQNPPAISGLLGNLAQALGWALGNGNNDGWISSTHFWYADDGDDIASTIRGDLDFLGQSNAFEFTVPNAYQKMMLYKNGGWDMRIQLIIRDFPNGNGVGCAEQWAWVNLRYYNLPEYFNTKRLFVSKIEWGDGSVTNYPNLPVFYSGYYALTNSISYNRFKENICWEILGRMCHLLQDMGVPAHANNDPHGDNEGLRLDSYESLFGDIVWTANDVYNLNPNILNAYGDNDPVHFLMYTLQQQSNHFASNGPHMKQRNDSFGGNPRPSEIAYLNSRNIQNYGEPTSMGVTIPVQNVWDKLMPETIKATAALLYWFAKESNIIPPPPPIPPMISNFTQNPVPICKGSRGDVYVNLSQGDGTIYYDWISSSQPSNISIVPAGNRCQIIYHNTTLKDNFDAPIWTFGCTVTNPAIPGWSSTQYFVPTLVVDCSGCPTLAFGQNGILIDENPLLITSLSNPGVDITDYYLINTPLTPVNNRINLTIHEPQTEYTWLDNVELIETRVRDDEQIAVSNEGQVINYWGIIPASIILNGETDITEQLNAIDSMSVSLKAGDVITVSLNTENIEDEGDAVIAGAEGPIVTKRIPAMPLKTNAETNTVKLKMKEYLKRKYQ